MKSEAVIQALVTDLKPVRRLPSGGARTLRWATFSLLAVALGSWALGTRADLWIELGEPSFLRESVSLLILFVLAGRSAFQLSIPGAADQRYARALPLLGLVAWLVLILARYSAGAHVPADMSGSRCFWRMSWLSLLPALTLFFMLRKAAPLDREWTGLMALLSAASLAMLGTQFVCAKDDLAHLLLWHFTPVLLVALAGISFGQLVLPDGRGRRVP